MGFDIGTGFSLMGQSIANQAGNEALQQQKADLESQKEILANQLAEGRETNIENLRAGHEQALIPLKAKSDIDVAQATSDINVSAHGKELSQANDAAVDKIKALSKPDMLAAQHAITMAATLPNFSLQIGTDGSAELLNTITGKVQPATGPDGQPIKFQNPAQMQAVTAQVNALRDHSRDVDYAYRQELIAATAAFKADPSDENKAAIQDVKDKYDPVMSDIGNQFKALTGALGIKSGIAMDSGAATPTKAPASPDARQDGQVYATPKGPMIWNAKANGWSQPPAAPKSGLINNDGTD